MVVGVHLILEGESPKTDVVEVLEPFKVRHSHTTCIGIQVLGRVRGGGGTGGQMHELSKWFDGRCIPQYVVTPNYVYRICSKNSSF